MQQTHTGDKALLEVATSGICSGIWERASRRSWRGSQLTALLGDNLRRTVMIYVDNGGAELVRQLLRTGEPFCVIEHGKSMWRFTPSLGLHVADIDELGNVVLTEHRLRAILAEATTRQEVDAAIRSALGEAWDYAPELVPAADDGANVDLDHDYDATLVRQT
ncbi:DUF3145 family protein [Corynebacterium pseudokroppenstedtii]|uniref:DUF3145 family protein n=1 Tax=Corynebacterium pseudokroppenstedtii TaxID=2804917 RepID=UPI0030799DFD